MSPSADHSASQWRAVGGDDLAAVIAIAAAVHRDYPEDDAVFAERLRLYPAGFRLLTRDGVAAGYVISHPWLAGAVPALNSLLGRLPDMPSTYYLHDLALLPAARGGGAAGRGVADLVRQAGESGFGRMSLVAVGGSAAFWRRQGFAPVDVPALREKLASYDADACYMERTLG